MNNKPFEQDHANMRIMLKRVEETYPDNIAFVVKSKIGKKVSYNNITYSGVLEDTRKLGTELLARGFGDARCAIMGENSYAWIMSFFAVVNGVGVSVPTDKAMKVEEVENCLNRSKSTVLFFDNKTLKIAQSIYERESTEVKMFVGLDFEPEFGVSLDVLVEAGRLKVEAGDDAYDNRDINNNEMSVMVFTSGTTAKSKAVMLSHRNITSNIYGMAGFEKMYEDDINMAFLPFHHVFGLTGLMVMLTYGAKNVFCDGLKYFQENLKEYKVSVFMSVPLLLETLYKRLTREIQKQGKQKTVDRALKICELTEKFGISIRRKMFKSILDQLGGNIRFIISGAAPFDPEVEQSLSDFGILVVNGYGLTEMAPVIASESHLYRRPGTVGMVLPNVKARILNPDEEGVGEVIASGPNVMLGYYENEEETNKVIIDGWYHTGDLGYFDKDGYLWLNGRKKNVIILKSGKNVFPEELEQLLNKLDYAEESMVFPLKKHNEFVIWAKIVYSEDYLKENKLDLEKFKEMVAEDIDKINEKLPFYKHIKKHFLSTRPTIKTTTAKTKRAEEIIAIREELENIGG
ncbi:MAG: AMP-binding protein [Clostridiales bacterium]|nr:AMP-binding protein [Clostridiales bacterium]